MAQPIDDGYTEFVETLGGDVVSFRPLTFRQRGELASRAKRFPEEKSWEIVFAAVARCIVDTTLDIDKLPPSIVSRILGRGTVRKEKEDSDNLFNGVWLERAHPRLARVSCESCRAHWFDPISGEFTSRKPDGTSHERSGPVICETQQKCPAGHYLKQNRLSEKNRKAYEHYRECKATGSFPDDAIVKRNALIIERAIQLCHRIKVPSLS